VSFPYATPARAKDLSGLPPTYMYVGELDLLRDENIEYATRLLQAGVSTEFHVYPGAFHGFEGAVPSAAISQRATSGYINALKRALHY
jgi:acetyl esterase/lipase